MNSVNKNTADDRELVLAAQSGDQKAFVEIVTRYQNLIVGVAFSILQDFSKCEDAAQDCFIKAWKKIPNLREPEKLRPWLTQIARNSALDHLRRNRELHSTDHDFNHLEDPGTRPDESLVQSEERATVLKALASLPEKYRLPLVLFYCDGQSIRAVARALDLKENTVKQQLSRGRTKLRKRMDGLIENVLGNTRPNALFTASVATAIGALSKPSAMAATAINSTSLAMTSSKSTLTTAALLMAVSLPIGYSAHKIIEDKSSPPVATQSTKIHPQKSSSAPYKISLEESELVQQWRKLRENYGNQHSDLLRLHTEIATIENQVHRRAFTAVLISEWAELHPAEGLRFFREKKQADWERDLFLQEMFQRNTSQAITALAASGDGWEDIASKYLNEVARRSPSQLAALVERLPEAKSWDQSIANAFDLYAQKNLSVARQAAEGLTGPNRARALAGIARAWAAADGKAAMAWAKGMENSNLQQAVLIGWSRTDPHAALDQMLSLPAPSGTNSASKILSEAATHDFNSTMAWIGKNHQKLRSNSYWDLTLIFNPRLQADPIGFLSKMDEIGALGPVLSALENSLTNGAQTSRLAIMEWLLKSEPSPAKTRLKWNLLNNLARNETTSAMKIAEGIVNPDEREKAIKLVTSGMTNGGNEFDTPDKIFDTASPAWKEAIITEVFGGFFRPEQIQSFQKWADRMNHHPKKNRLPAYHSVGSGWAKIEPTKALDWAFAQTDDAQREAAIKGASSGWSYHAPGDAREWIESQLSGNDREIAINGFVRGTLWENFDEAVTMANTIPSDQGRVILIEDLIETFSSSSREKVRPFIEKVDLPEAQQQELQQSISNKK